MFFSSSILHSSGGMPKRKWSEAPSFDHRGYIRHDSQVPFRWIRHSWHIVKMRQTSNRRGKKRRENVRTNEREYVSQSTSQRVSELRLIHFLLRRLSESAIFLVAKQMVNFRLSLGFFLHLFSRKCVDWVNRYSYNSYVRTLTAIIQTDSKHYP